MAKERKKREKVSVYILVMANGVASIHPDKADLADHMNHFPPEEGTLLYRAVPLPFRLESVVKVGAPRAPKAAK